MNNALNNFFIDSVHEPPMFRKSEQESMRTFPGGATRDLADDKPDYHRFLCPKVIEYYVTEYMQPHQRTAAGMREADNWKSGFGLDVLMASLHRHEFAVWKKWDSGQLNTEEALQDICGVMFNAQAMLRELLEARYAGENLP